MGYVTGYMPCIGQNSELFTILAILKNKLYRLTCIVGYGNWQYLQITDSNPLTAPQVVIVKVIIKGTARRTSGAPDGYIVSSRSLAPPGRSFCRPVKS